MTKVEKRAARFVHRQTQDKNAIGNECFRQLILFIFLSTLFIHFSAFSQAACVKRAHNNYAHKIEVHVRLLVLLLCLSKIDIWAVTNTQAQHKKVRNHFFVQETTSPTSNRYIYFVSFIIENQPSVECVELQSGTNCVPVTSLTTQTRFAVGFTR